MTKRVIPVVDLSQFTKGDAAARETFVAELGKAFHEIGFVGVTGHGIPEKLINDFYKASNAFFALSTPIKEQYEIAGMAGQRGYTSFGKEHAKQSEVADLKEFFQIGQEVPADDPRKAQYPDNVHVDEIPDFTKLGLQLYRAFEKAGGLQLLNKDEEWLPIMPEENEIVINVGDMLQRLTNNYLKSTTHRVVNPPREEWHLPRLSIPFFLHPKSEMDLSALPKCITADNPLHYEPITAGEYLDERLREIGLKK